MIIKEFLQKYHNYCVKDYNKADCECQKVNKVLEVTENGWAEVVHFPNLGYCLMLKSASDFCKEINVIK